MASNKSGIAALPDNGVTMKTRDGQLQLARNQNTLAVRFQQSCLITEQDTSQILHVLKSYVKPLSNPVVILDFARVQHLSSRMLSMLIDLDRAIRKRGGRLALVHLRTELEEIFTVTRLSERFSIFESFELAKVNG